MISCVVNKLLGETLDAVCACDLVDRTVVPAATQMLWLDLLNYRQELLQVFCSFVAFIALDAAVYLVCLYFRESVEITLASLSQMESSC